MQSRRTFLKASVAALIGSLAPFRSQADPVALAVVKNGFVDTHETNGNVYDSYAVEKGILQWGKHTSSEGTCVLSPACLFRGLSFSVTLHKTHPVPTMDGYIQDLIGPADAMRKGIELCGDVMESQKDFLRFGIIKDDGEGLWFDLPGVLFNSIGCSCVCFPDEDKPKDAKSQVREMLRQRHRMPLMATQQIHFMSWKEPIIGNVPTAKVVHP